MNINEMNSRFEVSCGHERTKTNSCIILCNDWCDSNPGYCYLKIFDEIDRFEVLKELHAYPKFEILLSHIQINRLKVCPFTVSMTDENILHVHITSNRTEQVLDCHLTCETCRKTISRHVAYYSIIKPKCSVCNSQLHAIYYPLAKYSYKSLGSLSLSDLSNFIDDVQYPNTYYHEGVSKNVVDAERFEDDIVIYQNHEKIAQFKIHEQKLRSIRHDYIASELKESTDMKLSVLGVLEPEGSLTPDYINIITKDVIELGTSNTTNVKALMNVYEGKRVKYNEIIESVQGRYGIIIVGINRLISNVKLDEHKVHILVNRFLEAIQLESKIITLCGFNIFSDNNTDDYKLSKLCMEKIELRPLEDKQFNWESLKDFDQPLTDLEKKEASNILSQELAASRQSPKATRDDLVTYLSGFTPNNSRQDKKRLCNVPMVMPLVNENHSHMDRMVGDEVPDHIQNLWENALAFETKILDPLENHLNKKANMFCPRISKEDKIELAKIGIGGKEFDSNVERIEAETNSKKSFHPDTNIEDIEFFLRKPWFDRHRNQYLNRDLNRAVIMSKKISTNYSSQDSLKVWETLNDTKIISFSYMISYIFTEIAYNYKHWTPRQTFIKKKLKYGITLIMYNPKSHIFVSFSIPRDECAIFETGKIGPSLYNCGNYYISDFCSYNEPTIEHFIKAGPYMSSLLIHLQSVSETNPCLIHQYSKDCLPNLLLLYLNNKTDVEELITSQRYLFMNLLEDVSPNPWLFVDRFPKVMRSRLTVHYLWSSIRLLEYYAKNRITKVPSVNNDMIIYEYTNIKSLFHEEPITLHRKINEFYFGYVISKERGRGNDRMFKVLNKIIEHEYMFRDLDPEPFSTGLKTPKFSSNKAILKLCSSHFGHLLEAKLGSDYKDKLYNDYLLEVSYTNFNKLATLKASSRDHSINLKIPDLTDSNTAREIQQLIDIENPNESSKRPKMIEAIITLVDTFKSEKGRDPAHVVELLPWCLNRLLTKGRMDSDCFAKPQHGGDREIHVLEVSARIVQYHVELFSRVVCRYFPSETTCNPDTKDNFVSNHYSTSTSKFSTFQTHSKSADASKWCQAHHTSHFAAMIVAFAPKQLVPFLITALSLWPRKCLNFPTSLASSMMNNFNNDNVSPLYKRFRDDFRYGKSMFQHPMDSKILIKSGMFQGILHTTSSMYHTMIQETMKSLTSTLLLSKLGVQSHITVVQGSDDSGMMISIPGELDFKTMKVCKTMLSWKENISNHLSVYTNRCKSSIGTHDLIEYNSEWHSRHKIIKPTIRWISACLEASLTERFIDRFRIFNGVLTQCLEGGATTLECSVIQLNQCCLHYMLMGFQTQKTSSDVLDSLCQYPDPAVGFFPCDYDISAGVTGVEFQLYCLYRDSSYGASLSRLDSSDSSINYVPENCPNFLRVKDYQNIKLRFCNMKIYNSFLSRLPIESFEEAIQEIEENPLLLFGRHTSWQEDQPNLTLKVHSQGVKESISNVSPVLRMMASAVYLQTTKCMSVRGWEERVSLLDLINKLKDESTTKLEEHKLFPLHSEFRRVYDMIKNITNSHTFSEVILKRTSKSKILIFEKASQDFPIIELCKRQWFGLGTVPLSGNQFKQKWESIRQSYSFLSEKVGIEGLRETCKTLDMSVVECKNLIESLNQKTRSIVLYDSNSKSKSLQHSLSRIYWPNTKLNYVSLMDQDITYLRSRIYSLVSYWCDNKIKEDMIKDWLVTSKMLSNDYTEMSARSLKLKIFRDYLCGFPKQELVSRILSLKQGVIGYFSNRQRSHGKTRSGKGCWLGQVSGVDVSIDITDNKCTLIRINSMRESVSLGRNLIKLLEEFKISDFDQSLPGWKLLKNGNFSNSACNGIPVIIDTRVIFNFASMIENSEWSVKFADYNLRLCVVDQTGGRMSEYTILSEPFTSRDWQPDTPIDIGDPMLLCWSLGASCEMSNFKDKLKSVPSSYREFQRFIHRLRNNSQSLGWNVNFFRQAVEMTFGLDRHDFPDIDYDEKIDPFLLEEIARMDFDEDLTDLGRELMNWDEEVEQHLDSVFCFEDNESDENKSISDFISALRVVNTVVEDDHKTYNGRTMPYALRFFSFINSMSTLHYEMKFKDLYKKAASNSEFKISGLLGKIVSILLMRYHVETDFAVDEDAVELDVETTILTESIKTNEDLSALNLKNLENRLKMIKSMKEGCSNNIFESLERTELKLKKLIEAKSTEQGNQQAEDLNYRQVVHTVINAMLNSDNHPSKVMFSMIPNQAREAVLNAMLTNSNPKHDSLTDLDKSRVQVSIQNKSISVPYIRLICETFNLNFISEYYEYDDGHDIVVIVNSFEEGMGETNIQFEL